MDPITMSLLAQGGSAILGGILNKSGKAYKAAGKQYEKNYGNAQNYLQPYATQGQEAYGPLSGAMNNLLNPPDLYNQFSESYKMSPHTQRMMELNKNQAMSAAQAMGLGGSTQAVNAIQTGSNQIADAAWQDYFKSMMDQYYKGADIASGLYGQGGQAANQMSQNAMTHGNNMADVAYNKTNSSGSMINGLLGNIGGAASAYMGGKPGGWSTVGGK